MPCPHCQSVETQEQSKQTSLGYRTFRCVACRRRCNERSGTPFNDLSVPTDIVFLVVLWRLRYPLSLRHLAEMFLERGFVFSHETVRTWEALVAPLLTPSTCGPSAMAKPAPGGRPTRRTSKCTASGAISIGPSTPTATWSTRC